MTDKIQKIRERIEKLKSNLIHGACSSQVAMDTEDPVNNELEDAAKHYLYSNILYDDVYVGNPTDKDCIEMFKAGAEWQKKQDQSTIELAEDHAMFAGMEKMKEEMMAKAIDGIARPDDSEIWCDLKPFNFKDGDKLKLIIIKED